MIERTVLLLDLTISPTWLTLFSPSLKRRCMGTTISLFSPFHEMRMPVCSKRKKEDRRAAALSNACLHRSSESDIIYWVKNKPFSIEKICNPSAPSGRAPCDGSSRRS
jgi:hypothetical protein